MNLKRRVPIVVLNVVVLLLSGSAVSSVSADSPGALLLPDLKLVTAQTNITLDEETLPGEGPSILLDPGIWLASLNSPFELQISRRDYGHPAHVAEIARTEQGGIGKIDLPADILTEANDALHDFFDISVRKPDGTSVTDMHLPFCPNATGAEPLAPSAPSASPYPNECAEDPFATGQIWAIQKEWAVDQEAASIPLLHLTPGQYRVSMRVLPPYVSLFHLAPGADSATANVTVVKGSSAALPDTQSPHVVRAQKGVLLLQRTQPVQARPARLAPDLPGDHGHIDLPDLVAVPAWNPLADNEAGRDLLRFNATVWNAGRAPLDVRGYRHDGSPIMPASQYLYSSGHVTGRIPAGTMGFDPEPGHNHWHFQQFAKYVLLDSRKHAIATSPKVGFCIGATDPMNLFLPGASQQPSAVGLEGECGEPQALSVSEYLPIGWGDTYQGYLPGQFFDITHIPNGTYFIEISANPMHVLREITTNNNVSVQKIVIGGRPGRRTVAVAGTK